MKQKARTWKKVRAFSFDKQAFKGVCNLDVGLLLTRYVDLVDRGNAVENQHAASDQHVHHFRVAHVGLEKGTDCLLICRDRGKTLLSPCDVPASYHRASQIVT